MPTLNDQLVPLIISNNAILFIGSDLHITPGLPTLDELIRQRLLERMDDGQSSRRLADVAETFERKMGWHELIAIYREVVAAHRSRIQPVHQFIARLVQPGAKIVTTRVDNLLEQAINKAGKHVAPVMSESEVAFISEELITVIKVRGDIDVPDSLVITDRQIRGLMKQLGVVRDVVRALFATRAIIFIGYDLENPSFEDLYLQVSDQVGMFQRKAFALVGGPIDNDTVAKWHENNLEAFQLDLLPFLDELVHRVEQEGSARRIAAPQQDVPDDPPLPPNPYKLLESYSFQDGKIFYGRDRETHYLSNRILGHRVCLVYGESGTGKTSLLEAGARPLLEDRRAILVSARPAADQTLETQLQSGLYRALRERLDGVTAEDGLAHMVRAWQRSAIAPVIFVIDQFEQFFLVYPEETRSRTVATLGELLHDHSLDLRFVFVVREDFFGRLESLRDELPGLVDIRFHLDRLTREAAREAMVEPARHFGVVWQRDLAERLLTTLDDRLHGGIAPPQMQIVCSRLFEHVKQHQSNRSQVEITDEDLAVLGGVEDILGSYLSEMVDSFAPEERSTVDMLLGALVTTGGVKQRVSLADLARVANIAPEQAADILDRLTELRLLQRFDSTSAVDDANLAAPFRSTAPDVRPVEYELIHDYLVDQVYARLGPDFWDTQKARELLRAALPEWQERGRLLPLDDLRLIQAQRQRLNIDHAEARLLFASAVAQTTEAGIDVRFWADEIPAEEQRLLLRKQLVADEPAVRSQTARYLGRQDDPEFAAMLGDRIRTDPSAAVRQALTDALINMADRSPEMIQPAMASLSAVAAADDEQGRQALEALTQVRDWVADTNALLEQPLQGQVQSRVRGARRRRYRSEIQNVAIRGMFGGAMTFAVGLGIPVAMLASYNLADVILFVPLMFIFMALPGIIAGASASFLGSFIGYLTDNGRKTAVWIVVTGCTALVAGTSIALAVSLFASPDVSMSFFMKVFVGGVLLSASFSVFATAPIALHGSVRVGMSLVTGLLTAFALLIVVKANSTLPGSTNGPVNLSQWSTVALFFWALVMAGAGSLGFTWGYAKINQISSNILRDRRAKMALIR